MNAPIDALTQLILSKGGTIYRSETCNITTKHFGLRPKIHSHVWIGDRVRIGDDVMIQAFVFIPNGVVIHDRVFLGPRVTFTNDRHPPSDKWDETIVEKFVSIGAGAIILPGVRLGEFCKIGAGSVVTKNVPPGETWVGNPARPLS